jgi:LysM repeat protein
MMHVVRVFAVISALGVAASSLRAQEQAGGPGAEELRELRKAVEQQAKQIEMLTREVARLGAAMEAKSSAPAASAAPVPAREDSTPAATAPSAPTTEEFAANPPPKAEPAHPKHIVVKGDTLTSIAKQYNITIAELQKANKEVNERKLQIGQTLSLPSNAQTKAPAAAATPEPKQNP